MNTNEVAQMFAAANESERIGRDAERERVLAWFEHSLFIVHDTMSVRDVLAWLEERIQSGKEAPK